MPRSLHRVIAWVTLAWALAPGATRATTSDRAATGGGSPPARVIGRVLGALLGATGRRR